MEAAAGGARLLPQRDPLAVEPDHEVVADRENDHREDIGDRRGFLDYGLGIHGISHSSKMPRAWLHLGDQEREQEAGGRGEGYQWAALPVGVRHERVGQRGQDRATGEG